MSELGDVIVGLMDVGCKVVLAAVADDVIVVSDGWLLVIIVVSNFNVVLSLLVRAGLPIKFAGVIGSEMEEAVDVELTVDNSEGLEVDEGLMVLSDVIGGPKGIVVWSKKV